MTNHAEIGRLEIRRRLSRVAVLVAMCGGLAGLSGCDSQTEQDRILSKAGNVLNAINIQGAMPAPSIKRRGDELRSLITTVKPVADAKEPATASAANAILARAYGGLGELAAKSAADEERQFLNQINVVRAKLDQWISQHAVAKALNVYDPTKDLADLDAQLAQRTEEVAKLTADLAAQEAKVADIRAQAEALRGQSSAIRQEESGIRARGESASQTARAEIIREAVEVARRADALERQAGETQALADKEAPVAVEIKNQIERVNRQKESLRKAQQDIRERAEAARVQSASATAEANAVGGEIQAALTALTAKRDAADGPTQEAIKQFTQASGSAKSAGAGGAKETTGSASASSATFQQSLGDVHATRARSLAAHAAVLDALAKAQPPLPGSSELGSKAEKASQDAKAARESAISAYKAARSGYEAARPAGDLKARYEALVKALEELEKEPVAIPAPGTSGSGGPSGQALSPEQAKAVEDEIRAAIAAASADAAAMEAFFIPKGEVAEKLFASSAESSASMRALDEALKGKFGKTLSELIAASTDESIKSNPVLQQVAGPEAIKQQMSMLAPSSAKIEATSATEAKMTTMLGTSTLTKQDGQWKMTVELPPAMGMMLGPMAEASKKLKDAVDGITAKVNDGSLATGDDAVKAVAEAVAAAMQGMMPGGGG